jgi:hypothetical protein
MNATQSLEDAARELAAMHGQDDGEGDLQVYWYSGLTDGTIRLAEVSRWYLPVHEGVVDTYVFAETPEVPFRVEVALLTPDEWKAISAGDLRLPAEWPGDPTKVWPASGN